MYQFVIQHPSLILIFQSTTFGHGQVHLPSQSDSARILLKVSCQKLFRHCRVMFHHAQVDSGRDGEEMFGNPGKVQLEQATRGNLRAAMKRLKSGLKLISCNLYCGHFVSLHKILKKLEVIGRMHIVFWRVAAKPYAKWPTHIILMSHAQIRLRKTCCLE